MAADRFVSEILRGSSGARGLEEALGGAGIAAGDLPRVMQLLDEMAPLGLVTLLAKGRRLGAGERPAAGSGGEQLRDGAVAEAAARYGFSDAHARQALQLLQSGTVEKDLAALAAETSRAVGQVPSAVAATVRAAVTNPLRVFRFAFAVARDLAELPIEGSGLGQREFERLLRGGRGSPGRDFPLFDHTFRALYEDASIALLRDWVLDVTGHESVQLAAIVFAQAQGVKLEPADIEAARATLREGDLTPALVQGVRYFQREHGDRFPEILGMMR